jgi:hypothetical protein
MVEAKEAILTVLDIDHENESDNWGSYDRTNVRVMDRDKYKGTQQANFDNILVKDGKWQTGYPAINLDCVDGDEVVRIDIRSTYSQRIKNLKTKIVSILSANLTNLTTPWEYMILLDRGNNLSQGKNFRYVIEVRLYIVDEIIN